MTGDMSCLNASSPVHSTVPITIANGSTCNASKIGSVSVDNDCSVLFVGCVIQDLKSGKQIGKGRKEGRLFYVDDCDLTSISGHVSSFACFSTDMHALWHKRLGHPNDETLRMIDSSSRF
ncbi:hypothetical protein Patl1_37455 [Pistacia atlantica]|nr:hypothetical protein Patl1_37455 [Pistacia atlantica]